METESHENDWQQSAKTESQTGDEPVVVTIAESLAGEDHWKDETSNSTTTSTPTR